MILVDRALEERQREGRPIRVGMFGAGFMARGVALQILTATRGMELSVICNRNVDHAVRAYREAGATEVVGVSTSGELAAAMRRGVPAVTDDPQVVLGTEGVEALLEVTGTIEYGANVASGAIDNGKPIVLMNAELDGTVGPILKRKADAAGVIISNADGDQPGVTMNLYRFVTGIGVRPVLCGNIKGLHDPYRTPTTQEAFARTWGQSPHMVTSFADGTKISYEQAIIANATGMRVARRGMYGPTVPAGTSIDDAVSWYPSDVLLDGPGIVDYVVGAKPSPGVFVLGVHEHPQQQHYLNLYKLGEGPLYCFYTPYHLCHFEVPTTLARAVLFHDAAIAPLGAPRVEVVATAKRDLKTGETVDRIGGYMAYGLGENADVVAAEGLMPMGLVEGCRLVRDVPVDQVLTYRDVTLPDDRLVDRLRAEQDMAFPEVGAARQVT